MSGVDLSVISIFEVGKKYLNLKQAEYAVAGVAVAVAYIAEYGLYPVAGIGVPLQGAAKPVLITFIVTNTFQK